MKGEPWNDFEGGYFFEPLFDEPSFLSKKMFGGLVVYVHGRQMLYLSEDEKLREWKGVRYPYHIWNGILVCTRREQHESLRESFPDLLDHPVLKSWLYLPRNLETFEETAQALVRAAKRGDPRIGIEPGVRRRKADASSKQTKLAKTKKSDSASRKAAQSTPAKKGGAKKVRKPAKPVTKLAGPATKHVKPAKKGAKPKTKGTFAKTVRKSPGRGSKRLTSSVR